MLADEVSTDDCTTSALDWFVLGDVRLAKYGRVSVVGFAFIDLCDCGTLAIQGGANSARTIILLYRRGGAYLFISRLREERRRYTIVFCDRIDHIVAHLRRAEIKGFTFNVWGSEFLSPRFQIFHGGIEPVRLSRSNTWHQDKASDCKKGGDHVSPLRGPFPPEKWQPSRVSNNYIPEQ